MSPPLTVTPELKALLRRVKLGRCLDTLPERLTLAHHQQLTHHEFLELRPRRRGHPPRHPVRRRCAPAPPGSTRR